MIERDAAAPYVTPNSPRNSAGRFTAFDSDNDRRAVPVVNRRTRWVIEYPPAQGCGTIRGQIRPVFGNENVILKIEKLKKPRIIILIRGFFYLLRAAFTGRPLQTGELYHAGRSPRPPLNRPLERPRRGAPGLKTLVTGNLI